MSQFPELLPAQRRALFEMVEIFRKYNFEGRAALVLPPDTNDTRIKVFIRRASTQYLDTDLDTLRLLDEAGYIAFTETSRSFPDGSNLVIHTLILKKLASDYYDWAHRSGIYRGLSGFWCSLRPFVLPALISSIFTLVVWIILTWLSGRQPSILP